MAEKNLPFISVIVPFYNIEECVTYCLDSLVAQDYEGEYEILCVDDGSTDGTPAALDVYAANHPCVKVLHKPNGGQSDARNFGSERACGDYLAFIDGDDVVSPFYLSALASGLQYGDDALVVGIDRKLNANSLGQVSWTKPGKAEKVKKEFIYREICFERILASVWARLAKKELFLRHPNPVGRVYEDTYITPEYINSAATVVLIDEPIYGYVKRGGSTVHPKGELMGRCVQYFEAIDHFCDYASTYFSLESDELVVFRAIEYSRLWRRLDVVADFPEVAKDRQLEIEEYVKHHLAQLVNCNNLSKGNKVRFILLAGCPAVYRIAFLCYDKCRGI